MARATRFLAPAFPPANQDGRRRYPDIGDDRANGVHLGALVARRVVATRPEPQTFARGQLSGALRMSSLDVTPRHRGSPGVTTKRLGCGCLPQSRTAPPRSFREEFRTRTPERGVSTSCGALQIVHEIAAAPGRRFIGVSDAAVLRW